MVPTVTRLSAQAAIVKIRRVDPLLLLLLLLVFTRLPRYFYSLMSAPINIPRSRRPSPDQRRRRRAFALPPLRLRLAAAGARSPCRRCAFAFAFTKFNNKVELECKLFNDNIEFVHKLIKLLDIVVEAVFKFLINETLAKTIC
jgi:hypothetical protein